MSAFFAQSQNSLTTSTDASNHGLTLALAHDGAPLSSDPAFKSCPETNAPLACVPIAITLRNEGRERILTTFSTCGWEPYSVEYKMPDGSWRPFPPYRGLVTCNSNVSGHIEILPGKSDIRHTWLASMYLDTGISRSVPPNLPETGEGYDLLTKMRPFVIRVRRALDGCIAGWPRDEPGALEALDISVDCVGRTWATEPVAILVSNELELAPAAPRD